MAAEDWTLVVGPRMQGSILTCDVTSMLPITDHFILLASAGFTAGAMNALSGGGSFVSLPALMAAGVPPIQANASSTVALLPGSLASARAFWGDRKPMVGVPLRSLLLTTIAGGTVGALLLLSTPTPLFDFVLPWLLLIATLALAFGRRIGDFLRKYWQIQTEVVLLIQFGLGIYGGYFGGAVGIMMLAVWGLLGVQNLKGLNAPRTLMVFAANVVAVIIFILAGAVHWPTTLIMIVAATIGGMVGAVIGRRSPEVLVSTLTLLLTSAITVIAFGRAYHWHL